MNSPRSNVASDRLPAVTVGKLPSPLAPEVRRSPEKVCANRLLQELQVPIAAVREMVGVTGEHDVPHAARMALSAAENQLEFVDRLLRDHVECSALENGGARPRPHAVRLREWCEEQIRSLGETAGVTGNALVSGVREALPSQAAFDAAMAARAMQAVAHVAVQRAPACPLHVQFSCEGGATNRLVVELSIAGGGFDAVECGGAFVPFAVRDALSRPMLGLTIGQHLCEALGGDLSIDSPGPTVCTYRLVFALGS